MPRTENLAALVSAPKSARALDLSRFAAEPLIGGFDDDFAEIELGPGDSQYELSAFGEVFSDDDSQVDRPAIGSTRTDPRPVPAREANGPSFSGTPLILPLYGRFVETWTRYHILATLGYGTFAFVVLGFLLVKTLSGSQGLAPTASVLVVGILGSVAVVLLALSALAVNVVLFEVFHMLRRLQNDPH
jgi:hypothetical protein